MNHIEEVFKLLDMVVTGEKQIYVCGSNEDEWDNGNDWDDTYAGNVCFAIDDYKIVIFNDCDQIDYIESIILPNGSIIKYDDISPHDVIRDIKIELKLKQAKPYKDKQHDR